MNSGWLFPLAILAAVSANASSPGREELVHYKIYTSPSGHFELEVDPTARSGSGPGNCKLTENGQTRWEAKLPFTFHEAAVSDNGTVAGYGYPAGKNGFANEHQDTLCVAIFGPDGLHRFEEKIPRQLSGFVDYGSVPSASGMFIDDDRFTLRVSEPHREQWRHYRLSDGKLLGVIDPAEPDLGEQVDLSFLDAVQVAGTPLRLLWWSTRRNEGREIGAVFTLNEPDGKHVWNLTVLSDYQTPDEKSDERLRTIYHQGGALLKTAAPGTFELRLASPAERVRYAVAREGETWRVTELDRRPDAPPLPPEKKPVVPSNTPEPEKLGEFTLEAAPHAGPVHDVSAFAFDGQGRIGFLRGYEHFVLIDQAGELLAEVPLNLPEPFLENARIFHTWIAGDRWLLTASGWGMEPGERARAWWIETGTRRLDEIPHFDCPSVQALAGDRKGGFVVISNETSIPGLIQTSDTKLVAFDEAGKRRWALEADGSYSPERFCSPEDVTVTTDGEIAVLDHIRKTVHFYDQAGKYLRMVDLKTAWGREPYSPKDIEADPEGGFTVSEMFYGPPFMAMRADGVSEITPKFQDGGVPDRYGRLRIAPDGRAWVDNRHNFLRLDHQGVVESITGTMPNPDVLGIIGAAACDSEGRMYLADDQTGSIHVFDAAGKKLHICKPNQGDVPANLIQPGLVATNTGRAVLRGDRNEGDFISFAPDGAREKTTPAIEGYTFLRGRRSHPGFLIANYQDLVLTNEGFAPERRVDRWFDRTWLESVWGVAVAEDGGFAVLGEVETGEQMLGYYSPTGDAVGMTPMRYEWETLDGWTGGHFVVSHKSMSIVADREGKPVNLLHVPAREGEWAQFVTRNGRELWVLEYQSRKVSRYAMPAGK